MNNETKISKITVKDIADFIRLDEIDEVEMKHLHDSINIAKSYISNYTGISIDKLDDYPDFVLALKVLCQDMYDNRALYIDKNNPNELVKTILNMHSINYL